jgi:hypothetical protein
MNEELTPYQVKLRCRLSARYHQQRRRVLLRRSRIAGYLGVALSMGMVAALIQDAPKPLQIGIPFVVALVTLADTLFGFTAQAFEHQALYRRYMELEQWLLTAEFNSDEALAKLVAIEADEPPVNRAAVDLCDNELLLAHGHEATHQVNPFARLGAFI